MHHCVFRWTLRSTENQLTCTWSWATTEKLFLWRKMKTRRYDDIRWPCLKSLATLHQSVIFDSYFYPHQSQVPAHLCTSPIPLEGPEDMEETPEGAYITGSGARRKKRRRKRIRSDTHLREEASSSSEEREREKEWERESDPTGGESPAADEPLTPLQIRSVIFLKRGQSFIDRISILHYQYTLKIFSAPFFLPILFSFLQRRHSILVFWCLKFCVEYSSYRKQLIFTYCNVNTLMSCCSMLTPWKLTQ